MQLKSLHQFIFTFFLLTLGSQLMAQSLVSKLPMNKNFLIERGTGHVCGSCPYITLRDDSVIESHPGRGMMIEYHFGPDAVPQAGGLQTDYRTPYGDSILSWPFYLNMMINRRDQGIPYGSTFIFGSGNDNQIKREADLVVAQSAPVNLAMSSSFNATTRVLTVNAEAYYTAASATALNFLQIAITEDSLISTQYDGNYVPNNHFNPYFNHPNVFRANMNGFQGDSVKITAAGTTISRTYTYTFPTTPYKWNASHCKLTMYMTESKNASGMQSFAGKIMTAIRGNVGGQAASGIAEIPSKENFYIYPNPVKNQLMIRYPNNSLERLKSAVEFSIMNAMGQVVYTGILKDDETMVDLSAQKRGVYFVQLSSETGTSSRKIVLID